MDLATLLLQLARRWWLVAAVTVLAVLGAALAVAARSEEHRSAIHFVLHPDASLPDRDLPNALEELKSDGPLVQTVIGVLTSEDMLRRAAVDAGLPPRTVYTVTSTARPGSALIDATLAGPGRAVVDRLTAGFTRAASDYVAANYSGYALDRLGVDTGHDSTGLSATQAVLLALLLGVALGVGLVVAELRLEPRLRSLLARRDGRDATPPQGRCRALTSKGAQCRNRAVDEQGYCRTHLAPILAERARRAGENGSGEAAALGAQIHGEGEV